MLFGSEEMKQILIDLMQNPHHYEQAAAVIRDCVVMHTVKRLSDGFESGEVYKGSKALTTTVLNKQDGEEVINDVLRAVLTSLDTFTISIMECDYNELQRQAWLRRIIYNIIVKHLRAKAKEIAKKQRIVKHMTVYTEDTHPSLLEETLRSILAVACKAPSKPEKIMAYIFNDLVFREITARKKNADAAITCEYMNGKKLFALKNSIPEAISYIFRVEVSGADIAPLEKALGGKEPTTDGEKICCVTQKQITDWSYRMRTYIFKHSSEIF